MTRHEIKNQLQSEIYQLRIRYTGMEPLRYCLGGNIALLTAKRNALAKACELKAQGLVDKSYDYYWAALVTNCFPTE